MTRKEEVVRLALRISGSTDGYENQMDINNIRYLLDQIEGQAKECPITEEDCPILKERNSMVAWVENARNSIKESMPLRFRMGYLQCALDFLDRFDTEPNEIKIIDETNIDTVSLEPGDRVVAAEGNCLVWFQDFSYYKGLPCDILFVVDDDKKFFRSKDTVWLKAPGYGGDPYGNGSVALRRTVKK